MFFGEIPVSEERSISSVCSCRVLSCPHPTGAGSLYAFDVLTGLTRLELCMNDTSGCFPTVEDLQHLSNLHSLASLLVHREQEPVNLQYRDLTGLTMLTSLATMCFCTSMKNLRHLKQLTLEDQEHNFLQRQDIGGLTSVNALDLNMVHNPFMEETFKPAELHIFRGLTSLVLTCGNLEASDWHSLAMMTCLQKLDLWTPDISETASALTNLTNLTSLHFAHIIKRGLGVQVWQPVSWYACFVEMPMLCELCIPRRGVDAHLDSDSGLRIKYNYT